MTPIVIPAEISKPYTYTFDDGRTATVTIENYSVMMQFDVGQDPTSRDDVLTEQLQRTVAKLQADAGPDALAFTIAPPFTVPVEYRDGAYWLTREPLDREKRFTSRSWSVFIGFAVPVQMPKPLSDRDRAIHRLPMAR